MGVQIYHSAPVEASVSRRSKSMRKRHDLDSYLWSLDESLRSHCSGDSTFKDMPNAWFAMEVRIPLDTILERDEFLDREKLWTSFVTAEKFEWKVTTSFTIKLKNESLNDLHRVLQAPTLKIDVARTQLHVDVNLLTSEAAKKDFEARIELSHAIGLIAHMTLLAADQAETIEFVPKGEVASHLAKISSGLSASPECFDLLLKGLYSISSKPASQGSL